MTTQAPPPPAAVAKTDKRVTLRKLFDQQKPELTKLLPRGMTTDRLFRMALTECIKNPKLLDCTAESWALAIQKCAAQGLYPDSELGYMYLIPRENRRRGVVEVNAQRGYQGDIALVRKSGELADIWAEVVYEKDEYKVTKGLDRNIVHVPYDGDDDPGKLRAVYAVAKLKDGSLNFVDLKRRDVMRHKASAQGTDRSDSPWNLHEAAMWKKTAIHELYKWVPKASEEAERIAREIAAGEGDRPQHPPINIDAVAVPVSEPEKGGLDALADQLEASGEQASTPIEMASHSEKEIPVDQATECDHAGARKFLVDAKGDATGDIAPCPDCGQEVKLMQGGRIVIAPEPPAPASPSPKAPPPASAKTRGQSRLPE